MYNQEKIKINILLDRLRMLKPEIGAYVNHTGSYENLLKVGISVTTGWLYMTRIEIEQSQAFDKQNLKAIADRFEKR